VVHLAMVAVKSNTKTQTNAIKVIECGNQILPE